MPSSSLPASLVEVDKDSLKNRSRTAQDMSNLCVGDSGYFQLSAAGLQLQSAVRWMRVTISIVVVMKDAPLDGWANVMPSLALNIWGNLAGSKTTTVSRPSRQRPIAAICRGCYYLILLAGVVGALFRQQRNPSRFIGNWCSASGIHPTVGRYQSGCRRI